MCTPEWVIDRILPVNRLHALISSTQGSLFRNLPGFREFINKPAETQTSNQLASFLVRASNYCSEGHEFESPVWTDLAHYLKVGRTLGWGLSTVVTPTWSCHAWHVPYCLSGCGCAMHAAGCITARLICSTLHQTILLNTQVQYQSGAMAGAM